MVDFNNGKEKVLERDSAVLQELNCAEHLVELMDACYPVFIAAQRPADQHY